MLIIILVIFLIVRLGYVAISKAIDETSSHTISYTNYLKELDKTQKIDSIIRKNLNVLKNTIDYNIKNNIHFYRITSNLIPLATKSDVNIDYILPYKNMYKEIADKIKSSNMRVDFHPDEFCVINTTRKEVLEASFNILNYHYNLLKAFDIKEKVMIVHVGSSTFGKEMSIARFKNNFKKLPKHIRECIVVENDDKIFNIKDTLELCESIGRPMVLDYHHYICNTGELNIDEYYEKIFNTWKSINPKVHFSSPKSNLKSEFRSHHDYINSDSFISFLEQIKHLPYDIDVMLEAKAKDDALFRLIRELKYKTNYNFIEETSFEI